MSGVVTIYLRCVVIPIKVLYGYGSHLSPIEQITMRMIATCGSEFGKIGADELIDLLGLGRSIANDVISGLWHRGHLALDFRTGEICLSARAMQFAMEGRLDELEAGELKEADAEVMYEQLTGIVLPVSGGRRPAWPTRPCRRSSPWFLRPRQPRSRFAAPSWVTARCCMGR